MGFAGNFCGGFLGMAGGFRVVAPADFFVFGWRIPRRFFSVDFPLYFVSKHHRKHPPKIHHFHGSLLEDFPPIGFKTASVKTFP